MLLREFAFDPVRIPHFFALVVGNAKSGKTTIARSIAASFPDKKWHWVDTHEALQQLVDKLPGQEVGFIFDDVPQSLLCGALIEHLICNPLHLRASVIICCQDVKGLHPMCRTHMDYVFLTRMISKEQLRVLYEEFMDEPEEFEQLVALHQQANKVLVFDNRQNLVLDPVPFFIYSS